MGRRPISHLPSVMCRSIASVCERSARPQKVDIGRHFGVKTQIPGVEHHGRQGGGSLTELRGPKLTRHTTDTQVQEQLQRMQYSRIL